MSAIFSQCRGLQSRAFLGKLFEAASLNPEEAQKFVTELLRGSGHVVVQPRKIAELAQGSPLMAYLLVEEAKTAPRRQ